MLSAKQRFGESFDTHRGKVAKLPNLMAIREEFCRFTPKKQTEVVKTFMDSKEIAKIERKFEGSPIMRVRLRAKPKKKQAGNKYTFRDKLGNEIGSANIKTNKIW